jgi:hypothetical protein
MKDKKIKIGQLLMESLTTAQIACMLGVVASAGELKRLMGDFKKADPDMAATVDNILKVGRTSADGKTEIRTNGPLNIGIHYGVIGMKLLPKSEMKKENLRSRITTGRNRILMARFSLLILNRLRRICWA